MSQPFQPLCVALCPQSTASPLEIMTCVPVLSIQGYLPVNVELDMVVSPQQLLFPCL